LVILGVVLVGGVAWLSINAVKDRDEQETASAKISITPNGFDPATITIKKGTDVTWTNNSAQSRSIVGDQENSGLGTGQPIDQGSSYSFVFDKAGTYTYHDPQQPSLKGTIVVEE
jgi:plastocyanin